MNKLDSFSTITKNKNKIYAKIISGDGPTLIVIPGTWGNALTRDHFIEKLNSNLNIICVALAGQDDNWPPPKNPSIENFSDDILCLADELDLEKFYVCGNSLGGMISIDMLRFGENRILGAVPIEGWTHHSVLKDAFDGDVSNTLNDDQKKLLKDVRHQLLDRWDPVQMKEFGSIWKKWNGFNILSQTKIPILEIWGDRGRELPSREMLQIPSKTNIEIKWVQNASHNLLIEAPEILADFINEFILNKS